MQTEIVFNLKNDENDLRSGKFIENDKPYIYVAETPLKVTGRWNEKKKKSSNVGSWNECIQCVHSDISFVVAVTVCIVDDNNCRRIFIQFLSECGVD